MTWFLLFIIVLSYYVGVLCLDSIHYLHASWVMMIHLLRDIYFDHLMWFSIIPSRTHFSIFSVYYIVELDIWSWSTIWHIMHLIYELLYFNIYVEMCLFDVVVALDVKKIEKKVYFCMFWYFTTFADIFAVAADKLHFGPSSDIFADTIYVTMVSYMVMFHTFLCYWFSILQVDDMLVVILMSTCNC